MTDRLLRAHFFRALVHNDLIAPRGDAELAFFHALALATLPGFLFSYGAMVRHVARAPQDPWLRVAAVLSDRAFLVALSMLALGFVAVWAWDELLPTRRDFAVLGPLPVASARLLAAKAAAVLRLLLICALALNLFSAPVFPLVAAGADAGPVAALVRVCAHLATLTLASAFVGFVAVAARGLLAGDAAVRVFQLSSFVLLVQSVFLLPAYVKAIARAGAADSWLLMLPPTWFVGLYATLAGSARGLDHGLAATALVALAASWLSCRSSYRAAGERAAAGTVAAPANAGVSSRVARWLNVVALRSAGERAGFWFVLSSLWRSPRHRLTLTGYAAVGLAASGLVGAVAGRAAGDAQKLQSLLVHATFVAMFFLLLGLRSAFDVPAELRANWLFRAAGAGAAAPLRAGSRKAALLVASLPALASVPALAVARLDGQALLAHIVYAVVVAGLSVEALLFRRRAMPMASPYQPGRTNLRLRWPLYTASFFGFVSIAAGVERLLLRRPAQLLLFVIGGVLLSALVRRRERQAAAEDTLLFEELPEGLPSLGLND